MSSPIRNHVPGGIPPLVQDESVTMVTYIGEDVRALSTWVESVDPLILASDSDGFNELDFPRGVTMFREGSAIRWQAVGEAALLSRTNGIWRYQMECGEWVDVNNRRYARHYVRVPIEVQTERRRGGLSVWTRVMGTTVNLSLGGVWAVLEGNLSMGTTVRVAVALSEHETVFASAIVIHEAGDSAGTGLAFVGFEPGSRVRLEQFIDEIFET